ncbi:hypothetical protein PoB_003157100 [Plakobranchus ocellatus]|uniref:Uncharacterized protein n=1 Tax=Plakobranchus ocellatus TaxID=259542 RepID=A0AAV4A1H1_9GAST|nr:hypothetical protein PoB_003157100 [Plakobranchus ocellatus]
MEVQISEAIYLSQCLASWAACPKKVSVSAYTSCFGHRYPQFIPQLFSLSVKSSSAVFFFPYVTDTRNKSPQQGDLRLSGPPSGQGASSGARTRDKRVPADLRADSQATVLPTPQCYSTKADVIKISYVLLALKLPKQIEEKYRQC